MRDGLKVLKIATIRIAILIVLQIIFLSNLCFAGEKNSTNRQYKKFQPDNHLTFTPNEGQIVDMDGYLRPDVLYKGSGGGADIYLRKTGISYVYSNMKTMKDNNPEGNKLEITGYENHSKAIDNNYELCKEEIYSFHRVDMDFEGCNKSIYTVNENSAEGYINYYLAHCPNGVLNVKQFNKVTFRNVYDNIDVAFYGNGEQTFKYDIIINPGADANQIKLKWSGVDAMYVNSRGNLAIKTSTNEFYESIPNVYQKINGKTVSVNAIYVLKNSPSSRLVTFNIGSYNHNYPLIIDPLTWITYFGGNEEDFGASVVTDGQHNVIFEGYTESPNLPVSPGCFQNSLHGASDGFVAKFSPAGARLWATYIGGSDKDEARGGIAVDANDNIYISSVTWSTDFPVKAWGGAFMQIVNNAPNNGTAYVAQFAPAGTLTWATYYGGSNADWGSDITVDELGNIIFTGQTSSKDFPVLNAYQPALKGATNAFVVKFNNTGVRQWATYYGGSGSEQSWGITNDAANNIYFCGKTSSVDFPMVAAFQGVYGGGADDAFFVKLNTANGNPIWSTYYGGSGDDWGTAVAADALGNVFLGLYTNSPAGIATAGAFQTVYGGGTYDGGLVKFTNTGIQVWGTYIGGNQTDCVTGIAIDMNNNITLSSNTSSPNFPVNNCSFQNVFQGSSAACLSKFSQQDQLLCSSFIDNSFSGPLTGGGIAVDGVWAYLNGSSAGNLPVTSGAFQSVYGGTGQLGDAAFMKLCSYSCDTAGGISVLANFSAAPATPCKGTPVSFTLSNTSCDTANTTYSWSFAGGNPSTSTQQNPTGITWNTSGNHAVSVKIVSPCDSTTVTNTITVLQSPVITVTPDNTSVCKGQSVILIASGAVSYIWTPATDLSCTNCDTTLCTPTGNDTYTITGTDAAGCTATVTATVDLGSPLSFSLPAAQSICEGSSITLGVNGPGGNYLWEPGNIAGQNITVMPSTTTVYTVTLQNVCNNQTDTVTVFVNQPPSPAFASNLTSGCSPLCINFSNLSSGNITMWSWKFGDKDSSNAENPIYCYTNPGTFDVTLSVTTNAGCNAALKVPGMITVYSRPVTNFTAQPQPATIVYPDIQFTNESTDIYGINNWQWIFGDQGDSIASTLENPNHTYSDTGTFCVKLIETNLYECTDSVTHCIIIGTGFTLYIPDAFTPGPYPGFNSTFAPKGTNIKSFDMYIYDRWGMQLYHTTDINKGWNGEINGNGNICQVDTYVYDITVTDVSRRSHKFLGKVTLLR